MIAGRAEAANLAVITQPPTILNLAVFLVAGAAVVICLQVWSVVKGGYLSRSWQLFGAGFALLLISQLSVLLQTFEIVVLPVWVTPTLLALMAALFCYGAFETRRVLS